MAQQDSAAPNTIKKDVSLLRMKVAIVTMFSGLSSTYSLVNVVADQIQMLLQADIPVKVLVSETCPDSDRTGIFLDQRIEWVKVTNTLNGKNITWHDYSHVSGNVHETFFQEADVIAADFVRHLKDVDVCILHDILYQGWHLVHNIAIRTAQKQLPHVRFLAFTHSLPLNRPREVEYPLFRTIYRHAPDPVYLPHLFRHSRIGQTIRYSRGKMRGRIQYTAASLLHEPGCAAGGRKH